MKLSEKITELRKANGMTQEVLAAICNVSRQSVSKWEADIALPETDKLLLLRQQCGSGKKTGSIRGCPDQGKYNG